jgi:small multidrug resistance pump
MVWILLFGAIAAEVTATSALKLSDGFSKLAPSLVLAIGYITSLALLALVLKKMDVGVAYAIWSGVGTAAIAVIGIVAMKEPLTAAKVVGVLLIIGGVTTLNLAGSH